MYLGKFKSYRIGSIMKKRQAEKIAKKNNFFTEHRLLRFTTVKKVYARLGKLVRQLPFIDPKLWEQDENVFQIVSFTSKSWYRTICLGKRLDSICVLKHQKYSILEMFDEYKEYPPHPQSLVVAYQKTGQFDQFCAETLSFNFIVGPVGKVRARFANQTSIQ